MADYRTLLRAVPARKRTERVTLLLALYVLGAVTDEVSTEKVDELLRRELRAAAPPRNRLAGRLRAYIGDVVLVNDGRPQKWKITAPAVKKLEELTGQELATQNEADTFATDVAIVCALADPELTAVLRAFGGAAAWKEVGSTRYPHVYRRTEIQTGIAKKLSVVATASTSMGLTAAAIVTTQMIIQFRPRLVAMVGIAGGTRDGGKNFGDVLVADPSVDYASGKVVSRGGKRLFQPDPYPIGLNPRLRAVLQRFKEETVFDDIRAGWKDSLPGRRNRLHMGPVGAADQVIDDAERVVEIQDHWRKLIGIEMESYGVYRACAEAPHPQPSFVSFKAVCDFAAEKADSWQRYAAYVAAEFTLRFLRAEWDALWHVPK